MRKNIRKFLAISIMALTLGLFIAYAVNHPAQVIDPILGLDVVTILLVLIAYLGVTYTNSLILIRSLELLKHRYTQKESFLLTAYSSIVNFFGPLQSGPGFRAVYLKKSLGIKLRDYTATLVLYYGFFGMVNATALGSTAIMRFSNWQVASFISLGVVLGSGLLIIFRKRLLYGNTYFKPLFNLVWSRQAFGIFVFTFIQCVTMLVLYFIELYVVSPQVQLSQAVSYTAVANLTLFIALTPGAIGIRESFLLFSQRLHSIDNDVIIAASIIDRALYFVFLLILFLITVGFHTKKRLSRSQTLSK